MLFRSDEGWGLRTTAPFPGDPEFSWHIIESVVQDEFDVTTCQQMVVDHAFTIPMQLLWPATTKWPVKTVPVCINTDDPTLFATNLPLETRICEDRMGLTQDEILLCRSHGFKTSFL